MFYVFLIFCLYLTYISLLKIIMLIKIVRKIKKVCQKMRNFTINKANLASEALLRHNTSMLNNWKYGKIYSRSHCTILSLPSLVVCM